MSLISIKRKKKICYSKAIMKWIASFFGYTVGVKTKVEFQMDQTPRVIIITTRYT